jgi:anti-sigma regulatory factor (Ser/Thr protein kinase)
MAGLAVQETVTLAGRAERARVARTFVCAVLGPGHPCRDDVELLVSELFGNSVRYSRSGDPGETITVAIKTGDEVVRVEVTDRSGPGYRSWPLLAGMLKAGAGLSLLRASRRGGAGDGAAGGR